MPSHGFITIRLPGNDKRRMKRLAKTDGVSVSVVTRQAIKHYLQHRQQTPANGAIDGNDPVTLRGESLGERV